MWWARHRSSLVHGNVLDMVTLESARLIMRPWRLDDVDFVFDMYSRWDVQRFIGAMPSVMTDPAEARAQVTRWIDRDDPVLGIWAVQARDDGPLLGTLLLKSIPASGDMAPLLPSGDIEIGWHLHPEAWGHGYATEAGACGLNHAFDSGLDRVVAVTRPDNLASQGVARRIGMKHEGPTDRYYNTTCELFIAQPNVIS
jgi:RimJ/RimL family protein N-acetyltransferase